MKRISLMLAPGIVLLPVITPPLSVQADGSTASVVIYQAQTGAVASASQEYIALYNNTSEPADITNWCVNYASASDATQTQLGCMKPPDPSTRILLKSHSAWLLATPEFTQAHPEFLADLTFNAGMASTSGHIKLLDAGKTVIDVLGWGSAVHPEGSAAIAPANGKLLQRHGTIPSVLEDLNDNARDFFQTGPTLPAGGNIYDEILPPGPCPGLAIHCAGSSGPGLMLSELLPDASGADAGQEFIELHNPTKTVLPAAGYSLQLGPAFTKSYPLPNVLIEPNSYRAFTDIETGLTLPNTSASLRLVAPDGSTYSEVAYSGTEEAASIAYINGGWQQTFQPTPGRENILAAVKPCPENQARNAESGQCRQNTLASGTTQCKESQIRSIETGRCRNLATATVAAVCKTGQQKNPATNRCVKVAAAAEIKACPSGQVRNPDTGRCKKISAIAASGTNNVKDVPGPIISGTKTWLLVGAAAAGTVGYAIFEWRQEILSFTGSIKKKLIPG